MFSESAILDDGRLVVTRASGVVVDGRTYAGPAIRFPDACLVNGTVWVVAKGQDGGGYVWNESAHIWMPVPKPVFGMRMVVTPGIAGVHVAYTLGPSRFRRIYADPDGVMTVITEGTIPTGEGAHGMRDWSGGVPRPLAPLDERVNGYPVRAHIADRIACSRYQPDQVVLTRGGQVCTLVEDLVNYATLRVSTNGLFWCGTAYATTPRVHSGRLPLACPGQPVVVSATGEITL